MATYVAIPKLGMSMTEATVSDWKVREGERVDAGDVVLEIETDKTEWEVEATAAGFLHILVEKDVTAAVGRVVGLLAETEEELRALQQEPVRELFTTAPEPLGVTAPAALQDSPRPPDRREGDEAGRVRISPVARKLAEDNDLAIGALQGTGPDGRIVREDVERALAARPQGTPASVRPETKSVKARVPLKGMRRRIAEHMHASLAIAAQLSYMGEIEVTEVVKLREALVARQQDGSPRVTYTDILVAAIARTLRDNPILNSTVLEDEIVVWEDINIGVAVALEGGIEGGLIVPVVRDADRKTVFEIGKEVSLLVEKARTGKLLPDDVSGGTFTLTNLGAVGGGYLFATPIISQPQTAILGTGSISDRAVVRDGQVVVRPVMTYSLTTDHRAIDGAPAARFIDSLTKLLQRPQALAAE
ncbi:MAG: 2-oxo acid dehydrogenase subunit E2 [Chloroflexi bacterium]|nr:2-oxo acid dehydrogenase subunit E2 [Chloroflexota bacterium]